VYFFKPFSTDLKSARNSAFFDTFLIFSKIFLYFLVHISTFSNFEAKLAKSGAKNQKTYQVNVS
jgi:hypothetical protein